MKPHTPPNKTGTTRQPTATLPVELQQLERRATGALAVQRSKHAQRLEQTNQELTALASASVRAVMLHALRHGISTHLHSGQPHQTAVSEGAMLVAAALKRDGVAASELQTLLALWQTRIDSDDLFVAAEQLLGPGFGKLPYQVGTPMSDVCEILFGSAHEVGDLIAAGAIVASIQRKLTLLENNSQPVGTVTPAPAPSKPKVKTEAAAQPPPDKPAGPKPGAKKSFKPPGRR